MKKPINPRQFALDVIAALPENATFADVQEDLEITIALLQSIKEEEEGKLIPHAEVMAELNEWLSKRTGRPLPATT